MKKTKKFGMGGDMPAPTTQDLSKMLRAYEEAGAGKPAQPNATMPNPMAGVKKPYTASPAQQEQDMRNAVKQAEANVDKSMSPTPKPGKPASTQPVRDVPKTGSPRFVLPPTLSRPVIPPRPRIPPPRPTTPVPPRPATPVDPIPPRPPTPETPRPPTPPPSKLPQGINPNFKPGEGPKYTGPGFGPKGPAAIPVGPKPQVMGGSSDKMGTSTNSPST